MKKIILIGGGGHCRSVIDVIESQGLYKICGIIDKTEFLGSKVLGYEVIGNDHDLKKLASKIKYALIAVGQVYSPKIRIKLFNLIKKLGFQCPSIISPRAYVSKYSNIGAGTIVMHDVVINANVSIGDNCIINTKALIEHDCTISSHCHISTSSVVNGSAIIKSKCFIGSNSVIKDSVLIKEGSFVKAGSLVK